MMKTRKQQLDFQSRTAADMVFVMGPNVPLPKQARRFASPSSLIKSAEIPCEVTNPQYLAQKRLKKRHTQQVHKRTKLAHTQVDLLSAAIPPVRRSSTSFQAQEKDTLPLDEDFSGGNTFFPSVIFGEHEQFGLSKIGRADKEIQLWEKILAEHKLQQPSLVPVVEQKLREAEERRKLIDGSCEENHRVGEPDPAATAIKARLKVLQWALDTSKFEAEAANIRCVMKGYMSGAITYSTHYTLIWAGRIVDTASHYNEFTRDRSARLDRYFRVHGPGWLFYESPLKAHPSIKPKMGASVALKRSHIFHAMEGYYVTQGFWKQANYVSRMSSHIRGVTDLVPEDRYFARDSAGKVDCGSAGPKLAFKSMLDSGATYPTLHQEDLMNLEVDPAWYAAQTVQSFEAANGSVTSRMYELYVCVLDDNAKQLVDPHDAVWPFAHKYLGSLCPVAQSPQPLQFDENGIENSFRLSGMMPFVACYVSSTPGRNTLFLGEDRNDVLGSHRMPGQKKWAIEIPPIDAALPDDRYGNPHITFRHREDRIIDMDCTDKKHASTITFLRGTRDEKIIENNPGGAQMIEIMRERFEREMQAHGPAGENLEVSVPPLTNVDRIAAAAYIRDLEMHDRHM